MKRDVKKKASSKGSDSSGDHTARSKDKHFSKRAQKRFAASELSASNGQQKHLPLEVVIKEADGNLSQPKSEESDNDDNSEENAQWLAENPSHKILDLAKEQREEIKAEEEDLIVRGKSREEVTKSKSEVNTSPWIRQFEKPYNEHEEEPEEHNRVEEQNEYHVDSDEDALFQKYVENGANKNERDDQLTLADKIMEKIRAKEAEAKGITEFEEGEDVQQGVMLPPKVIQVYVQVGDLLSRYRSGKLPRAFKIIPTLQNWEDVLYATQPESWSHQAVYEATSMFISTLSAQQAQKFVSMVLLERFKAELDPNAPSKPGSGPKTLNYHVYRALKKSLYKPAAFFKGFLFPLAESGSCSLREAAIASSILTKTSVPVLHSAAALLRLADYEYYSGPISMFMKVLLEKKYALPYKVVDSIVFHFMRFRAPKTANKAEKQLPVIWHQTFLVFAQRYKNDITEDQRDALLDVLKIQNHPEITPEIRRELQSGVSRSEEEVQE